MKKWVKCEIFLIGYVAEASLSEKGTCEQTLCKTKISQYKIDLEKNEVNESDTIILYGRLKAFAVKIKKIIEVADSKWICINGKAIESFTLESI